jgi:4'-phosphopantetheinyl transferase
VEAWSPTETVPELPDGECQVWWAVPAEARGWHAGLLAPDELQRRERLLRPADRHRMTVAYALARLVLAAHLGTDPEGIRFERTCLHCAGPHGKPQITGSELRFSLSHSGDRVAFAVTRGVEVGVDVEELRPTLDLDGLADTVLAEKEASELAGMAADARLRAFLTYWTRKEAVLKATGEGLQVPLNALTVTGLDAPPQLAAWIGRPGASARFQLHDLTPGDGYLAALAALDRPVGDVREYAGSTLLS